MLISIGNFSPSFWMDWATPRDNSGFEGIFVDPRKKFTRPCQYLIGDFAFGLAGITTLEQGLAAAGFEPATKGFLNRWLF